MIKRAGFDKYGIEKYYGTTIFYGSNVGFYCYAVKRSKQFDVVHVHSLVKVVPFIRKPKVLHFHGSDLRGAGTVGKIENYVARKFVNKVLVSTPDLLSILMNAEWLPNPVDTELFYPQTKCNYIEREDHVTYPEMPCFLCSKGWYVQSKDKPQGFSTLSLQALACDVPVVWNGLVINCGLPPRHEAETVAERTIQIYGMIVRK